MHWLRGTNITTNGCPPQGPEDKAAPVCPPPAPAPAPAAPACRCAPPATGPGLAGAQRQARYAAALTARAQPCAGEPGLSHAVALQRCALRWLAAQAPALWNVPLRALGTAPSEYSGHPLLSFGPEAFSQWAAGVWVPSRPFFSQAYQGILAAVQLQLDTVLLCDNAGRNK